MVPTNVGEQGEAMERMGGPTVAVYLRNTNDNLGTKIRTRKMLGCLP